MKILYTDRQLGMFEELQLSATPISEEYKILDEVLSDRSLVRELAKDLPETVVGRNRMSAERILRILILRHQKQLSYRNLERQLKYDIEDRWFCLINETVPCFKTLQNQWSLISEDTIKKINDRVLSIARAKKITQGKRLRVDSTVTEMNIHYPTDASLIQDGIRIIHRLIEKSEIKKISLKKLKSKLKKPFTILRTIGRRNKEIRQKMLSKIVSIGKEAVTKTKAIKDKVIAGYHKLLARVVKQGVQVLRGTTIIKDRIVSIFEPGARPIRRGKAGKSTEFGKVVQIQEDEVFVTNWQISGTKNDEAFLSEALSKHKKMFKKMPEEVATDRGYWTPENFALLKRAKVKHISLPKKGKLNPQEKQRQRNYHFKKLQRWRAGGEAKISWLKRKFGLRRCLDKGEFSYGRWVGAGILANNLIVMAKMME